MPLLLPVGLLCTEYNLRSLREMTRRLVNNTADEFDELVIIFQYCISKRCPL